MNNFSRKQYEIAPNLQASQIKDTKKLSSGSRSNIRIVQIIIVFIVISFILIFLNMVNHKQNDTTKNNFREQNNQRNSSKPISNKKNTTQNSSNGQQIFKEKNLNKNNDDSLNINGQNNDDIKKTVDEKDNSQKQGEEKEDEKAEQNRKEKERSDLICNEGEFFSKGNCSSICPQDYFGDEIDRLCKPKQLSSGQVQLFKMEGSNDKTPEEGFYEILSSRGHAQNKDGRNGFFFFNKQKNEGFNFLNSAFGSTSLSRLLENVDGMIVTLPGSDQLFIDSESNIKNLMLSLIAENTNITSWYTCGIFDLGGFSSLRYLDLIENHLKGGVVLDPDYLKQDSDLSNAIKNNLKNYDLLNQFKMNKQVLSSKNVLIIEKQQSSQKQFTLNLQSFIGLDVLYYERERKLSQDNSVVEMIFFPVLEQFISSSSKIAINQF